MSVKVRINTMWAKTHYYFKKPQKQEDLMVFCHSCPLKQAMDEGVDLPSDDGRKVLIGQMPCNTQRKRTLQSLKSWRPEENRNGEPKVLQEGPLERLFLSPVK